MNTYKTKNLSLCPFLQSHGLEYLGLEGEDGKIVFVFKDEQDRGDKLSLDFLNSKEKEYRNLWAFFRAELERGTRNLKNENFRDNY